MKNKFVAINLIIVGTIFLLHNTLVFGEVANNSQDSNIPEAEWIDIDIGGGKSIKIDDADFSLAKNNYYVSLFARNIPQIIDELRNKGNELKKICNLFAGRGTLAIAFAKHIPEVEIIAVDNQKEAWNLVTENAQTSGVSDRIKIVNEDAFKFLSKEDEFDLIICNFPFIPRDMGRFSDAAISSSPELISIFKDNSPDGRYFIDRLITDFAVKSLKPGGAILFMQGDFTNMEKTVYLMRQQGLVPFSIGGKDSYVIASETRFLKNTHLTQSLKDYIEGIKPGIEGIKPYRFGNDVSGEPVFQALVVGGIKPKTQSRQNSK